MRELLVSRRQIITAGAAGALGVLLNPSAVFADDGEEVSLLRWDLVQIIQGTVLVGGMVRARDAATGDVVTLTGSGEARPGDRTAAGGGTFVHKHANGSEVAHGVYVVTAFKSFRNGHGSLVRSTAGRRRSQEPDGFWNSEPGDQGLPSVRGHDRGKVGRGMCAA